MKKGMPWASPSLDACDFLYISEEVHGSLSKIELLSLLDLPSSLRSSILENLLYTKLLINFIRGLVLKQNNPPSVLINKLNELVPKHWILPQRSK